MSFTPTPEQRAVIEHPLESFRVAAGAGSGKTGTMALRLAHHVSRGDIDPEQALGITFTNKAAAELADRVRRALPELASEGREVEISTYHGFAFSLLREFGALVGFGRDARVITPGYARQILRDAIAETAGPLLDLTRPGAVIDQLSRLSSTLGDHLSSAQALVDETGDPVAAERAELARILIGYEARKRAHRVLDYSDLVTGAHRLLRDNPDVVERVRQRYRLVLLDEYQDTSPGEREMLRLLFGDRTAVTAVGDTDQTIYEWKGASPHNFASFGEHFPLQDGTPATTLNLSVTWRNDRRIVDAANRVRDRMHVPGPLPALEPRPDAPDGTVITHWERSAETEARWIADELEALHESGTPWREMAIIFRKHRQMAPIHDHLRERGIPVEVASLGGLLEVPEVVELHAWLRILGRPHDAVALARILLGSRHRLGLSDLMPLVQWLRGRSSRESRDDGVGWALLEAVDALEDVDGIPDEARKRLARFRTTYRDLLVDAQRLSLVEVARSVLDRTGAWLEVEAMEGPARLSTRLNLYRFLDLAEEWSPLDGSPTLQAFLDHLEALAEDTASGELDTARISGEDAVPLVTVHGAKGLEWDAVFLPALADKIFPSGVRQYEDPLTAVWALPRHLRLDLDAIGELPDDLDERKAELRRNHLDQEWRTAYVAVTRARSRLYASGAFWTGAKNPRRPSPLFDLIDDGADRASNRCTDPGEAPERRSAAPAPAPDPLFAGGWRTALSKVAAGDNALPATIAEEHGLAGSYDSAVDQLAMHLDAMPEPAPPPEGPATVASVTGLVTLAGCPLRFRWSEIDRLPRRPSRAARIGTEIHRRIEIHNRGTLALDDSFQPDRSEEDGSGKPGRFGRFLASRFAEKRPELVEVPFTLVLDNGTVSGRIDAVYRDGDDWEIVDFKSGAARDDPTRRVQLQAYAVALRDTAMVPGPPAGLRTTFAYLGGEGLVEIGEAVDQDWLDGARARLEELLEESTGPEYPATPSSRCRSCDFLSVCRDGREWLAAEE